MSPACGAAGAFHVEHTGSPEHEGRSLTEPIKLDIAIASYPHTAALLNGEVRIEGVAANFIRVIPQIAAYRRMVRDVEFDVCEIAPTTYMIARAYGASFIALPIFVTRRFHHSGLLVHPDAAISHPKDLEGRKVGVRAYSVTTGVWTRAILIDEYGLDSSKVTWVVDDEEHVRELKLPPNVVHAPQGRSLADMMAAGELSAGFDANAGIGRSGSPTGGWQQLEANYPELFANAQELEASWYKKTGIYPMHGTIVIKDGILKAHPWLAQSLYTAFAEAKALWLTRLRSGEADTASDRKYRQLAKIVGQDPLPFGIEQNLPAITALEETAFKQKLTPRRMPVEELFIVPDKSWRQ
jgi:4,5-dihydroxyphthalate decarboxylase